ncbi:hypothetical protein BC830DRAFT_1121381 [Chytriomyces sp. MP71]|nr:hypothetical protein BC830DRAFT_1121381 [Chytriomyces sp. MP71]
MEAFTQWCLVCERKLVHDAVYCSLECLKTDFVGATSGPASPAAVRSGCPCHQPQSCPPSPTPSHSSLISDSNSESSESGLSGCGSSSRSESAVSPLFEASQSILSPAFSLEFKSRRGRAHRM